MPTLLLFPSGVRGQHTVQGFLVATPTPAQTSSDPRLSLPQNTPTNPQDHTTDPHLLAARASSSQYNFRGREGLLSKHAV